MRLAPHAKPPRNTFSTAGDILKGWTRYRRLDPDRLVILHQVWEREAGGMARHWSLSGVRAGVLYVKTRSPAAAQELQLRGPTLVRALNKYFQRAWIKEVRASRD
ncbi:MAG: DUF721 domain-containing protein [Elusimicrobiota bacterium]|jgi:hypothetical protein